MKRFTPLLPTSYFLPLPSTITFLCPSFLTSPSTSTSPFPFLFFSFSLFVIFPTLLDRGSNHTHTRAKPHLPAGELLSHSMHGKSRQQKILEKKENEDFQGKIPKTHPSPPPEKRVNTRKRREKRKIPPNPPAQSPQTFSSPYIPKYLLPSE